jgi:succinate-acetate transporter protein
MGNIIAGLIAIALGLLALISWPWRVLEVAQGLVPIVLFIGGIVAIIAGIELTKEKTDSAVKKDEEASVEEA